MQRHRDRLGGRLRRRVLLLVLATAACAASRDRDRRTIEPHAVPTRDSVAALAWGSGGATRPPRGGFGVVVYREIGPVGLRFVLARARGCRDTPQPAVGRDVVLEPEAQAQGCRLRPYHGPIALSLRRDDGSWWNDALELEVDDDGQLHARFAELDASLTAARARLDRFTALRVGRDGWAGTYDLVRLRRVQADLHAQWIARGRGSPALFAVRHAEHPLTARALELAVDERLARQESDFAAVERGELSAAAFLDRHVWSPLRHRVQAMLLEQRSASSVER